MQGYAGPAHSVDLLGQLGSACQSFISLRQDTRQVQGTRAETRGHIVVSSPCDDDAAAVDLFLGPPSHPLCQSIILCLAVAIFRAM